MRAFEETRALATVDPKEEGDFDPTNIQSKITKTNLVKLHNKFPIPQSSNWKCQGHRIGPAGHLQAD